MAAPGVALTYAGLVERAGRLAAVLSGGRASGRRRWWGCACRAALDMVTAVLAAWRCGAAYLPLDPGYPPARLEFMLADSGAAVLVTAGDPDPGCPRGSGAGPVRWGRPVIRLDDPAVRGRCGRRPRLRRRGCTAGSWRT